MCKGIQPKSEALGKRASGRVIDVTFRGALTLLQSEALKALLTDDTGVLVLPTGVGKTVVAIALIAQRATSTLIIVNRRPLLDQWRAQLATFLGLSAVPLRCSCQGVVGIEPTDWQTDRFTR